MLFFKKKTQQKCEEEYLFEMYLQGILQRGSTYEVFLHKWEE